MKRIVYHIIAAAAAVCLWGCGENYPRENILKIYNWSDYIDEDLIEEFEEWYEEQTGEPVHIVYQLFDINEVMLAKIERGFADFDLACPSDYIIERMIAHDLVLPIDKDFGDTPNYLGNVSPYMNNLLSKVEGNGKNPNDYAVPYMWGTTGFLYNSKMVKAEELTSWKALWNPKFAQKMFIKDAFRDVYCPLLIYAKYDEIMAGTVDIDSLMYDTSDESIALVESMLSEIRPSVLGWEADFGKEMMTQEVALLNLSWSGDAKWAIDEALDVGVELDYIVPSEGS
ncbi:MAG: extracellular solute-binding protein, partial [Bacteroidales bacterium]|nr:extracellular solute-binding protein [Bacteroidales bacterium]